MSPGTRDHLKDAFEAEYDPYVYDPADDNSPDLFLQVPVRPGFFSAEDPDVTQTEADMRDAALARAEQDAEGAYVRHMELPSLTEPMEGEHVLF